MNPLVPVEAARWMAGRIPGARFVELPGDLHLPWFGNTDAIIDEVEELVTGGRRGHEPDRRWLPCYLPISSIPLDGRRSWASGPGASCSSATTPSPTTSSPAFAAATSKAPATGC
jgi:hypothetical protein